MKMTHQIKLGCMVVDIVAPTKEGFIIEVFGKRYRTIIRGNGRATVVGRARNGRMQSIEVTI
jgi:hypothetical protein